MEGQFHFLFHCQGATWNGERSGQNFDLFCVVHEINKYFLIT